MEKVVILKNKKKKQLIGISHIPEGERKWPLVVICHGFAGTKTDKKFITLARTLEQKKIAAFRFDFEGCGDSEGELEKTTVKKQTSDLKVVITYLLKQGNIDRNKIAFLGHSLGSVVTTIFIAKEKLPIKSLVFWAPALNQKELFPVWNTKQELKQWDKQGYYIRKDKKFGIEYLKENRDKDYSFLLAEMRCPILIIHNTGDEAVPVKFSRELANLYQGIKLIFLPGTDHKFENYEIQQELIKKTSKWFNKYLK